MYFRYSLTGCPFGVVIEVMFVPISSSPRLISAKLVTGFRCVAHRLHEKNFCELFMFVTPLYTMRSAGRKKRIVTQTNDNHVSRDTLANFLDRGFQT